MSGLEEEEVGEVHIVHKSVVPLLFRALVLLLVTFSIFSIIYLAALFYPTPLVILLVTIASILVFISAGTLLVYFCVEWVNDHYVINNTIVVSKSGVLSNKEESFLLEGLEDITILQGFWGKIFNYGNIHLEKSRSTEVFDLFDIPNPRHLEQVLHKKLVREKDR